MTKIAKPKVIPLDPFFFQYNITSVKEGGKISTVFFLSDGMTCPMTKVAEAKDHPQRDFYRSSLCAYFSCMILIM